MKKSITILLVFMLSIGFILPAAAYHDITISAVYDSTTDSVLVSGTVDAEMGNIPLTLELTDPSGAFAAAAQTVATLDAEGVVRYSFEAIQLSLLAPGGNYTATVSGHFVDNTKTAVVKVPGASDQLTLLQALIASDTPFTVVHDNAASFNADADELSAIAAKGQQAFNGIMTEKTYQLPASVVTEEDARQVKEALQEASQDVQETLKITEFNDIATQSELTDWLDEYYSAYGFDADSDVTAESEVALTTYVELVKNEAEFLSRLMAEDSLLTPETISQALYEAALLTTISTQSDYQVINVVKTFTSFFPVGSLSEAELAARCAAIGGNYYATYAEATAALTNAESGTDTGTTGSTGSSGGRGSGWGSSGESMYIPSAGETTNPPSQTDTVTYTDLAGYDWADDAIAAMTEQGVITGRGNGIFAPGDRVTRAEMVKILLLATGLSPDEGAEIGFSDVNPEAWYAPYIAAAREAGLAQGTDDGRFMPEADVTRQDLAVLIYRAFAMAGAGEALTFADSEQISDYAADAVSLMVAKGIIFGVGDNRFAPLDSATRAQAALMVYRAQQAR